MIDLRHGDCLDVLREMEPDSVDAVVCDPPYGLEFMGKEWDRLSADPVSRSWDTKGRAMTGAPRRDPSSPGGRSGAALHKNPNPRCDHCGRAINGRATRKGFKVCECDTPAPRLPNTYALKMQQWHEAWAREVFRVLKPGGHLLAFGGTRTYHRLACAVEDAGFEIRDSLAWVYGSGFPKSLDVSKAIDKVAGAEREVVAVKRNDQPTATDAYGGFAGEGRRDTPTTTPATEAARQWEGWGTALKPAHEIIIDAIKPHTISSLCGIIGSRVWEALCQLASSAKGAVESSTSSPSGCAGDVSDSALWTAAAECNTLGALCDLTDTWPSKSAAHTSLNIASSWLHTLDALSTHASMFTTETASSLITDLQTLSSSNCRITPDTITEAATAHDGSASSAALVDSTLSAAALRLNATLIRSALGGATAEVPASHPAATADHIVLARKPLAEKTVAANVLEWGTGGINVDGCRVEASGERYNRANASSGFGGMAGYEQGQGRQADKQGSGRFPANLLHDGSDEVLAVFPVRKSGGVVGVGNHDGNGTRYGDEGSAARFFYCAKASRRERGEGCTHPTVKPLALMRYLVRLVTPPGGTVLDPFLGSGTTAIAAHLEGFNCIGIEREADYLEIARARVAHAQNGGAHKLTQATTAATVKPAESQEDQLALFAGATP